MYTDHQIPLCVFCRFFFSLVKGLRVCQSFGPKSTKRFGLSWVLSKEGGVEDMMGGFIKGRQPTQIKIV